MSAVFVAWVTTGGADHHRFGHAPHKGKTISTKKVKASLEITNVKLIRFFLIVSLAIGSAMSADNGEVAKPPPRVSLLQLLTNPKAYHKKRIAVAGFYFSEMESTGIYLSRDDARFGLVENGLAIGSRASKGVLRIDAVSGTFALIQGTFIFTGKGGGHLNSWPAEIEDVTLLVNLPSTEIRSP